MKRFLIALIPCLALVAPAPAADSSIVSLLVEHWKTSKAYTLAIAEQMPEDSYAFKPNPEQMSFGEQLNHLAGANAYFVALVTATKSPLPKPANAEKATVLKMLNDSYDFVIKALASVTEEQLHRALKTPDGKMSGLEAILLAMDHTAHHRGQCIVYLRVKNIKPADYRF